MSQLRVFIGYHEMAGYCIGLVAALRAAGARPHFCNLLKSKYYKNNGGTAIEAALRAHLTRRYFGILGAAARRLIGWALKAIFLIELLVRYDAFVFVDKYSPIGLWERSLLRLFRRRVVSVFLGSDSRPVYQNGAMLDRFGDDWWALASAIRKQYKEIREIERGSNVVICHVPCAHFLSKPFVKFLSIGFPFDEARVVGLGGSEPRHRDAPPVRVLHAPSSPKYKGTAKIVSAIEELKAEGLPIVLEVLQNRPNTEVLRALASCDFVVDELYSDSPLAGLAVEAAAFGKPSIVGTNASQKDLGESDLPPSIMCPPSAIKATIRAVALDKASRESIGLRAKDYLQTKWSSQEVGKRILLVIEGKAKPEWYADPKAITYVFGWGIAAEELREKLKSLVEECGASVLHLEDKPECHSILDTFIARNVKTDSSNPLRNLELI